MMNGCLPFRNHKTVAPSHIFGEAACGKFQKREDIAN
jgi:hypothetical protein